MDDRPGEPFAPDRNETRRHNGRVRLSILTALDEALSRYDELIPLIVGAADRAEAADAVSRLLGVGANEATAVLDLQWGRLTRAERDRITDARRRQEQALAD